MVQTNQTKQGAYLFLIHTANLAWTSLFLPYVYAIVRSLLYLFFLSLLILWLSLQDSEQSVHDRNQKFRSGYSMRALPRNPNSLPKVATFWCHWRGRNFLVWRTTAQYWLWQMEGTIRSRGRLQRFNTIWNREINRIWEKYVHTGMCCACLENSII